MEEVKYMKSEFIEKLKCQVSSLIQGNKSISDILPNKEYGINVLDKEKGKQYFLDAPTYESAGKGYAWIMLNYSSLSDENKEELFLLEEAKDSNGINIGEKIVWFVQGPSVMYDFNITKSKEQKENTLEEKFKNHSFILQYNSDRYPKQVVILRMPINNKTTVTDVELYFEKITERLKSQQMDRNTPSIDRE